VSMIPEKREPVFRVGSCPNKKRWADPTELDQPLIAARMAGDRMAGDIAPRRGDPRLFMPQIEAYHR
jgi:hypothetical protein